MSIENLPASLQGAIQQDLLLTTFQQSLRSLLMYRTVADKKPFPIYAGQTITETRAGLKASVTTPLNPQTNTNLDNGVTPSYYSMEQYVMGLNMYGDSMDVNIMTGDVAIASTAIQNAIVNGEQAARTMDELARDALYNAYLGGNTYVNATLGSPGTTVAVDDIRGFTTVLNAQGQIVPIGGSNTLPVTINGVANTLLSYTIDATNISNARDIAGSTYGVGGVSGTLTFQTTVQIVDGTSGNAVIAGYAPAVLRPNGRADTSKVVTGDIMTMSILLDAIALLRNNAVPTIDGMYHVIQDSTSERQLFADPEFQLLYRGTMLTNPVYKNAKISEGLGIRFFSTTQAPQQLKSGTTGINIRRPIVCGQGVLVEGVFAGQQAAVNNMINGKGHIELIDGVVQVVREPLDRFQQIIAQSWYTTLGYSVPTDATANRSIIPTASNAYLKRAVIIETA